MTNSMIEYQTTFESTNNLPMQIAIGHGENADLIASFKDDGVDVDLTGFTAMAIYQPKSKWGTDDWYECPCEIVENTAIAHWGNPCDNGDNAVKLFMNLSKNGKVAYPAIYHISLFETPGFNPSPIVPTSEILDFSQYTLLNAPWVETEDYTSDITEIRGDITSLESESVKSIEYTGNNKIIVKQFVHENPNAVIVWKATGLGTMTQNIFSKTGDDGEYWTYACFDASTNQWAWFKIYSDFEISLDFILHKSEVATVDNAPWVPLAGNATITGNLTVESSNLIHSETKTITYQSITYSNDTESYYTGNVVVDIDKDLKDELLFISDEEIPIKITGTLASSDETVTENATLKYSQVSPVASDRVRWIVEDENGVTIGSLDFSRVILLQANSGTLHGDFLMSGSFGAVYDEEVQESKNYIYDDFSKASKMELRQLEAKVKTLSGDVDEIVEEKIPFIKKVVQLTDSINTVYPKSHEVMGVHYTGTQPSFTIGIPNGDAEGIVDFYVDVIIPELIPLTTITVGLALPMWRENNYYHEWKLAYDYGKSWASMNTLGVNTITRFHFRELGIVDANGNPYLYITAETLASGNN